MFENYLLVHIFYLGTGDLQFFCKVNVYDVKESVNFFGLTKKDKKLIKEYNYSDVDYALSKLDEITSEYNYKNIEIEINKKYDYDTLNKNYYKEQLQ